MDSFDEIEIYRQCTEPAVRTATRSSTAVVCRPQRPEDPSDWEIGTGVLQLYWHFQRPGHCNRSAGRGQSHP